MTSDQPIDWYPLTWQYVGNTAGFGQVADGRPFWTGDFSGAGRSQIVFYYPGDQNWWLGTVGDDGQLTWQLVGNTGAQFGALDVANDPFWTGDFSGVSRTQIMFYDWTYQTWSLGTVDSDGQLAWQQVGNTSWFVSITSEPPSTGDFSGVGRTQIMFYDLTNQLWRLGTVGDDGQLTWQQESIVDALSNTFGVYWTGDFSGVGRTQIMFYAPGDQVTPVKDWWLGTVDDGGQLAWQQVGNTSEFGYVDSSTTWTGDFSGAGHTQLMWYYPDNQDWWLGMVSGDGQLIWQQAGNTAAEFGRIDDGRPLWSGDFFGTGRTQIMFYDPGDEDWWLGTVGDDKLLTWQLAANTAGFGQIADGRPFWAGDFSGTGRTEIMFYYPGDQNWWLGTVNVMIVRPSSVAFGDVPVNGSATAAIAITNAGYIDLPVTWSLQPGGEFSANPSPSDGLAAGQSTTARVTISATTTGTVQNQLTISNGIWKDKDPPPIPLSATGTYGPADLAWVDANGTALGSSTEVLFTQLGLTSSILRLRNMGSYPAEITHLQWSPDTALFTFAGISDGSGSTPATQIEPSEVVSITIGLRERNTGTSTLAVEARDQNDGNNVFVEVRAESIIVPVR